MGDEYRVDGIELPDFPAEPGSDDMLGETVRTKVAAAAERHRIHWADEEDYATP